LLSLPQPFLASLFPYLIKLASNACDGGNGTLLRFNLLALVAFAQSIDVNQILCSSRRELCYQQVLSRDKWPTIRYLTCPALKADNSSLKSWCICGLSFHPIKVKVEVHYGANSLASRQALPGPVFVRLHRLQAIVASDSFVHLPKLAQLTMGTLRLPNTLPSGNNSASTGRHTYRETLERSIFVP
jgi:hypothetical protein